MSAVDALLGIVVARSAEGLTIQADQVPMLTRGETDEALSMPPIGIELVRQLVNEVLGIDQKIRLERTRSVSSVYESASHGSFAVSVSTAGGLRLIMRRSDTATTKAVPAADTISEESAGLVASPAVPEAEAGASSVAAGVTAALRRARAAGASDVILSAGVAARMRIDGGLVNVDGAVATNAQIRDLLDLGEEARARLDADGSLDVAWTAAGHRYRLNVFAASHGLAAAFRLLPDRAPTLDEINLPAHFTDLVAHHQGLVLITGATGSGKSTTLAALIEHLNRTRDIHIITLEDPVELTHTCRRALIHQREVGLHVPSFHAGLHAALRESPDVILVGEMRNRETIGAALTAAETGHLVLSTLHSGSGPAAIDRIIDVYPEHQQPQARAQLAACLRAVVTQHLLPAKGGGRVAAYEKLVVTPAVASLIRDNSGHLIANQIQTGRADGMVALDGCLAALVRSGRVERAVARRVANLPSEI